MNASVNSPRRRRSGDYVQQIQGYTAFIPRPLPPDPPINIDNEMLALLSRADRELGRLDGASETLPNPDLFVAMYVHKEAVLSSQIEGTQASLVDVLAFESEAAKPENEQDIAEVVNYVNALHYGLERLATLPLSLRLIREIHKHLLSGTRGSERRPGEFRNSQNWIGGAGATLKTALFVPPPVRDMHDALGNLEAFLHSETPMPLLLRVGLSHAQFETIHPFLDGNGRMGRLLITFLLCQRGVLVRPLLYLSHYFRVHRSEYYDRLQAIRDGGDWEGWLKFFLHGVAEVAAEATDIARRIVLLREAHRTLVTNNFGRSTDSALRLLESLYTRPIITVALAAKATGLTYQNANKLVARLQHHKLLQPFPERRARTRLFVYAEYLEMFADPEAGQPRLDYTQEADTTRDPVS